MTELTVAIAVLAAVVVALVLIQLGRAIGQGRAVREELARVSLALAQSQSDLVDRFHKRLSEFGQQVQGGQASTGEALQKAVEGLIGTVNTQLTQSQKNLGERFEGATKLFADLQGQLGQVREIA